MSGERKPRLQGSLVERRISRVANARYLTVGLAVSFLGAALLGAVIIRIVDEHDFPTLGLAVWWALQTITTVGYGDVVPTTHVGRFVGSVELVLGVSFITFLTAGVTSTVIRRANAAVEEEERTKQEGSAATIVAALAETRAAIADLEQRLARIEAKLPT
jgi:voltage-gated potassium channel